MALVDIKPSKFVGVACEFGTYVSTRWLKTADSLRVWCVLMLPESCVSSTVRVFVSSFAWLAK